LNEEKTVGIGNTSSFEARMQTVRAGVRVNSRVPVAVEWSDEEKDLRAEGYTVDTSTKGCLAVVPQPFGVGQRLKITNLATGSSCEAVLIWRGHEGRNGWELGLELQGADMDFWGVDLF
jgi:hypothetical protein